MAIKQTIKGTGKNSGSHSTWLGPRTAQTHYIGSKEWIAGIRKKNESKKAREYEKKYGPARREKARLLKKKEKEQKLRIIQIKKEVKEQKRLDKINEKRKLKKEKQRIKNQLIENKSYELENIKKQTTPLNKAQKIILHESYNPIFLDEFNRLAAEGDPFSPTDLNRAVIDRIVKENPTINLEEGKGLDKVFGGNEEAKTMHQRTDKGKTSLLNEKQRDKFTHYTSGLKVTKNQDRLFKAILAGDNDFDSLMKKLEFNSGRLKGNMNKLMRNLAKTNRADQPLFLKQYSDKELEKVRQSVYESESLEKTYQRTILQSILASTQDGSPERKAALKKLREFNMFKAAMENNGIDSKWINLDHAASYRAIKNGNLTQFLAVTPMMKDINAIKSTFDRRSQLNLRRMQEAISNNDMSTYKKYLTNQEQLEGIWKTMTGDKSSLGKIRVQPGGKKIGVTKIVDFGATNILDKNKNLINELADNLDLRKNIVAASTDTNLAEVSRIMLEGSEAVRPKASILPASFRKLNDPAMFKIEDNIRDFIAQGQAGGPICNLSSVKNIRVGEAAGGPQGPGCAKQVQQALQENPDQLIQEAANSKVKPGENTKFRTIARQLLSKIPKGGRLGALIAGAGAVGLGTWAMTGDAEADDTRITDQSTMAYNSTTGTFDNTLTGDPEDQEGILNWIADNPGKAGFSALPAWMGLGYGLSAAGMKRAGQHLMSWKAIIPAMMVPEKMYQWKQGMEPAEMATDPLNALWVLGIENKASLAAAEKWYNSLPEGQRSRLGLQTLKDLRTTQGWKNLPQAFRNAVVSPAAAGTDLAFQKRLKPAVKKLTESIIGSPGAKQVAKKGLGALAKRAAIGVGAAALLPATVAAGLVSAPLTLGLGALSFGYAQYKDYRDGKAIVDAMRAKGQISEEDAENYMSLIKQGSLPFGLGNRLFGDDEMTIRGQTFNPEQQRELLRGMEDQIDLFQDKRKEVRALDRADDFGFFSEGGRVGMKFGGGMDRRGFLKWLTGLGAAVVGGASGLLKLGGKQAIKEVAKQAPKQFANVPGMPAWFPRAVQKIKTHGKLIEMADKDYINGDIYEMIIPTKVKRSLSGRPDHNEIVTVNKKVLLEENPISGEIEITWSVDDFDGEMTRQINFRPGETGFQKFGVDPEHPGAWEYQRVKVQEPEFTYGNPDQSTPERDAFEFKDIFEEGDEVVKGLEDLTGNKKMVAKDGSIIDTVDEKGVDEAFQKKIFKDAEGEEALLPDPEGHMTPEGWSGEKSGEVVGGDVPEWVPKDTWQKKAGGGTVETGDIARRQSLVPPLAGPNPQGIMGLPSEVKQVRVG